MVIFSDCFFLCRLWMKEIIISLLSIVILDSVMKFIVVEIDIGMLCKVSVRMLLVSVNGMLVNISKLFLMLLNIVNNSMNIISKVMGMMICRCCVVDCRFLNWLF